MEQLGRGWNLAKDMRTMLDDPARSGDALGDVVLITKDGHRLRASRTVLAARSCFFHAMLTNGLTLDSQSSEISLPSVTTHGLVPTLEFLYTGSLSRYTITLANCIDIIHASTFFLLAKLEHFAHFFFHELSLDEVTRHRAELLSHALELLTPDYDRYRPIIQRIMNVMPGLPLQGLHDLGQLSFQAMCFYLETTRNSNVCILTSEYSRLRLVLMWCAHSISGHLEEVVKKYMPPEQSDFLRRTSVAHDSAENRAHLDLLKPHRSLMQDRFEPFLDYLDLFQVHPEMLARVVEPMGTIPDAYLMQVFRFHAVFSKDMLLLRWGEGAAHHHSYVTREEGSVLEHAIHDEALYGFGRTDAPVASTTGIYEWDIIVERDCPYLGIGFCSPEAVVSDGKWLGYSEHGWLLCCHGSLYHNGNVKDDYAPCLSSGSRVRVHVDFLKATCSFTVDGTPYGVAWDNIPSKIFPAVSMEYPGRVRIEFSWTEDKKRFIKQLLISE